MSGLLLSRFSLIDFAPDIEPYNIREKFKNDPYEPKYNLTATEYTEDDGSRTVSNAVHIARRAILNDDTLHKNYLPPLGLEIFTKLSTKLLLGRDSFSVSEDRAFGVQTLGSAGGLRLAGEIFTKLLVYTTIYLPDPINDLFEYCIQESGFENVCRFRWWDSVTMSIDFIGLMDDLQNAPANSVVGFYACCHNPTGTDLSRDQWLRVADLMEEKKLVPLFNCAYIGLDSGDMEIDAWPVRLFASRGFFVMAAQTYSFTFTLYDERVGNLVIVATNSEDVSFLKFQISVLIRGMYTTPPAYGVRLVAFILNNNQLFTQQKEFIVQMARKLRKKRCMIREEFERISICGDMSFITKQRGLHLYILLRQDQIEYLQSNYHIYVTFNGRMSIPAFNSHNMESLVHALKFCILKEDKQKKVEIRNPSVES